MKDDPASLPDSYVAYRDQAANESAYAQAVARASQAQTDQSAQAKPAAPGSGQQEPATGMSAEDRAAAPQVPQVDQPVWPNGQATPAGRPTATGAPGSTGTMVADSGGVQSMIDAEVNRLAAPPFDKSRYANPEEALRNRAMQNLGVAQPAAEPLSEKVANVARDVGYGVTEIPKAVYAGVHGAIGSVLKMGDALNEWTDTKFNDWHMGALNAALGHDAQGFHWESGAEVAALKASGAGHEASYASGEEDLANRMPLIGGEPRTVTGNVIKNVAQFVTGMSLAGNQLRALGMPTNLAGWAGRGVTAAQGFLAQFEAFDGAQHRLSDLVQAVPALRNPVNRFLASSPDDNEAEGRLKNALEGTAIGQAADGVLAGIRMLRGLRGARGAAQGLVDAAAEQPPPAPSAGMDALGDVWKMSADLKAGEEAPRNAPLVDLDQERWGTSEQTKLQAAAASVDRANLTPEEAAGHERAAAQPALFVNFSRIDTPDDIKNAMQNLADKFSDDIDLARRGVQTFQQTQLGAQAEDAWKVLMNRRVGQPLNDTQSLAARQLWASSASKTMELADIASKAPTVENLYAFRKMLVTHAAIQEQVMAARTETARALSSWRIPAGEDALRLEGMVQQLSGDAGLKGGAETALELAQKVSQLGTSGDWEGIGNLAEKGALAKTRDAVLEAWTNGLLTSPLTHVKVAASNMATIVQRIGERAFAARISQTLGDADGVQLGEASAQVSGLIGGFKDAFRFAGKLLMSPVTEEGVQWPELGDDPLSNAIKAAKTGQYSLEANAGAEYMQHAGAISSETLGMADSGWAGKGVDLLGQVARSPGRALTAEHDFFRSIGYRMELNANATRQAAQEVNAGVIPAESLGSRIQELIENPPYKIRMDSVNGTLYQTFTDAPGSFTQHIGELRNEYPLLRVILPFYKIPSRIMSFSFERTPLAPLMSTFRQNFAAGGARQSLALAQMGLGTGLMLATADHVLSGNITGSGPSDKGLRAAMENEGWQPYSIRVGDKWMQYNRIEPSGSSMAMAADAVEAMNDFHSQVNGDDPDVANLGLATVASIANDITSKSYLQGLSNFFEAIADPKSKWQEDDRFSGRVHCPRRGRIH